MHAALYGGIRYRYRYISIGGSTANNNKVCFVDRFLKVLKDHLRIINLDTPEYDDHCKITETYTTNIRGERGGARNQIFLFRSLRKIFCWFFIAMFFSV